MIQSYSSPFHAIEDDPDVADHLVLKADCLLAVHRLTKLYHFTFIERHLKLNTKADQQAFKDGDISKFSLEQLQEMLKRMEDICV